MKVLAKAPVWAGEHPELALVTVVAVRGSTPRHVGTHMLVSRSGAQLGTIGGGRVELELVNAAREVAAGAEARLLKHDLVRDLAMCCGGSMEFFIENFAHSLPTIEEAIERRGQRESVVVETALDGSGKRIVSSDDPRPFVRLASSFRERIEPSERVILFGCGHLAAALGPLARSLDFDVVVCDDNETAALDPAPAWAAQVVPSFSLSDIERRTGPLGRRDFLLILTRDHAIDQQILESCLPRVDDFDYLGLIGSQGKVGRFRKRILAKGRVSAEQWQALHTPMGLDIGAETPEEIAVSILSQLIEIRSRGRRS